MSLSFAFQSTKEDPPCAPMGHWDLAFSLLDLIKRRPQRQAAFVPASLKSLPKVRLKIYHLPFFYGTSLSSTRLFQLLCALFYNYI